MSWLEATGLMMGALVATFVILPAVVEAVVRAAVRAWFDERDQAIRRIYQRVSEENHNGE